MKLFQVIKIELDVHMYSIMFFLCINFEANRVEKTLQKYKNKMALVGHFESNLEKNAVHQ